ncbi:MAG TPA: hypothetical protein VG056_02355 [Pirellulales bacterium]|jgi:hypothetical protein|nr:hypothetical protein [Pirellulales bacterium]
MGLTVYYEWKTKSDLPSARRLIAKFRSLALKLPFDEISEIFEQDPPDGITRFLPYAHAFRRGGLYLSRKREDGEHELVDVPALHALFFNVYVKGAETASIGLASHPPVVLHREDIIERDDSGKDRGRLIGQGNPIEFPTRRRGYYSWHSFCKTQYAGNPKLGGEANFLKAHLSLIELLDQIDATGVKVRIRDDSRYAKHRNVDRLLRSLRHWDAIIASVAGAFGDALGSESGAVVAPIKARPDFEHLEAKGIAVLKKLAARQRRRKRGSS